jgi:hypothetical protein
MARSRSTRKSRGLVSRLYSPLHHAFLAGEEGVAAVTNTARNIVRTGIRGVDRVGSSVTRHADGAVRNVFTRKSRNGGSRKNRKNRRNSRKNRRNSRKNRRNSRKNRRNSRRN